MDVNQPNGPIAEPMRIERDEREARAQENGPQSGEVVENQLQEGEGQGKAIVPGIGK